MTSNAPRQNIACGAGALAGLGVFFLSFGFYLATAAPSVPFWDGGELLVAAASLGVPHAPGYPTFCMLERPATLLPLGNAAFRINLASAFFCSAAVWLLYALLSRIGGGRPALTALAAAFALTLASAKPFWAVATVTEVYALNAVMLVIAAGCLYLYDEGGDVRLAYCAAFVSGLAMATHQSLLFSVPAIAAYLLLRRGNFKRPLRLLGMLALFLFGYSVVLYLPVRTHASPLIDVCGAGTMEDFFWALKWPEHFLQIPAYAAKVKMLLSGRNALFALAAGAALAAAAWKARRQPFLLLASALAALNFAGIKALTYGDTGVLAWGLDRKFYSPALLFGLVALYLLLARHVLPRVPDVVAAAASVVMLALPAYAFAANYGAMDNSKNFVASDFARNTLNSPRQGAALFAWGDNGIFPAWYLQRLERYREDVLLIHTELLTYGWYTDQTRAGIRARYGAEYQPPSDLMQLGLDVGMLKAFLTQRAPVYFDYSAAKQLGVKLGQLRPQGLIHLDPSWPERPMSSIWDWYSLRGLAGEGAVPSYSVEGIREICAWEAAYWTQEECLAGRAAEAQKALAVSKSLGFRNEKLDALVARTVAGELKK